MSERDAQPSSVTMNGAMDGAIRVTLDDLRDGYCGEANRSRDPSRACDEHAYGSVGLLGVSRRNWTSALSFCASYCAACARCSHVSLSLQHKDCRTRDGSTARVSRSPTGEAMARSSSSGAHTRRLR